MAKKKKQPPVKLLSPENYIRQKARNLPIYECLINVDWEETGTANVVLTRIHTNGNLTYGAFLVDLLCLGVKDTMYRFNQTEEDFDEFRSMLSEGSEMQKVEYSLIHNIIFAANEFAAEYGFKPHKDFISVTKYLLDEDTDDIELIEIECGRDGKPLFIKTDTYSEAGAKRIINQLEETAGKGNYTVIMNPDADETDDDEDDERDDEEEFENEFDSMPYADKISLFNKITSKKLDNLPEEEKKHLIFLTDSIYSMDVCQADEVEDFMDKWEAESEIPIDDEAYTAELLSLNPGQTITAEEEEELDKIDFLLAEKPRKVERYLNELRKKWGNIPYLNYKEVKYLELHKQKVYKKKVMEMYAQFADYPLFKLEKLKYDMIYADNSSNNITVEFDEIFQNRNSIAEIELFEYQVIKFFPVIERKNMNEIEAMYYAIDELDINEDFYNYLKAMIALARIQLLKNWLK